MINKFISLFVKNMAKQSKKSFFSKLLDKNDPALATSNFLVVSMLFVGLVLLIVPIFILIIESWYNHTISTDLNGLASYITSVAAIFATAGVTKIGVHYTDSRNEMQRRCNQCNNSEETCECNSPD